MADIISTLVSRAPCYQIKSNSDLSVTIEKEDTSDSIEATLVNISAGGAKFKVSEAISAKEVLALTIEAKRRNRTIVVSGEVCWVRPTAGDDWWLGCALDPQIPEQLLCELSEDGTIERREHQREEASLRTTAQWELNNETASAWILNYSRGGFCLLSQFAGKPGERVRLQLELDDDQLIFVPAKTQWVVKSQEGFVSGCEFLEPADYNVLSELAASRLPDKGTSRGGRRHLWGRWFGRDGSGNEQTNQQSLLRRSCVIAAGTAVLCVAGYHGFLSRATKTQQSIDQRDNSPDSSAARSAANRLVRASAGGLQQDATQAVRPAVTGGGRSSDAVEDPIERIRPTASVAQKHYDRVAGIPHAAPSEDDIAESRIRGARLPAGSTTWPIRSARTRTPTIGSEMQPDTSPRQLETNRLARRTTADVKALWDNLNNKSVELPYHVALDIAEISIIGSSSTADEVPAAADEESSGIHRDAAVDSRQTERSRGGASSASLDENGEPQESDPPSYRTWTDSTGRFRVVARFVNLEGSIVRLRTKNGRYKVIPLDRLSQHDARYVRSRLSALNQSTASE